MMNEKVIMVDCDGVLLEWTYSFFRWMEKTGLQACRPNYLDLLYGFNVWNYTREGAWID